VFQSQVSFVISNSYRSSTGLPEFANEANDILATAFILVRTPEVSLEERLSKAYAWMDRCLCCRVSDSQSNHVVGWNK
jgi:hypothetical protein